jgi:hypothetical protein
MKKAKLLNDILQGLLMSAIVAMAAPHFASAQDLNASVSKLTGTELTNVPDIINACFYIGGAAFTGSGLLKLKQYSENPGQTPLGQGVGRVSVGAGLLALPYISSALVSTFGFGQNAAAYQKFNVVQ